MEMKNHKEVCNGRVKAICDRDSGRHVVGWKCRECGRRWGKNDRQRQGATFVYEISP